MSTLIHPTVRLSELDLGHCIGDGAEQACYELADSDDVVLKQVNYIEDGEILYQNSTELAERGLAPDVHAAVINDDGEVCGVIVDKCEVIEPHIDALIEAVRADPLPGYDHDDMLALIHDIGEGEWYPIDDCLLHGTTKVKEYAEEVNAFFTAAQDMKEHGLSDMHVFNVGFTERGDFVCIDTCSYVTDGLR